jgi:hypothetical protein
MPRNWSRFGGLSRAAQRHPLSSICRTTAGCEPDVLQQAPVVEDVNVDSRGPG